MTETLLMHNLFRTPKSPAPENHGSAGLLDVLLTVALLTSIAGILATVSIFAALLLFSGSAFGGNAVPALAAVILVLTVACSLSWWGLRIAIRDARGQAAHLAAVLDNIGDGVLTLDEQGNFVSANAALLRMIPEDRLREMNNNPLEETLQWQRTVFSVSAAPIARAGSVVVFHDETRRYETEQAKEALLATVSHELRTPLGVMMNYLELMTMLTEKGKMDVARFSEHLKRAIENGGRLLRLINAMLDQAQLQSGATQRPPQVFNLLGLLQKTLDLMEARITKKQLFFELKTAQNVPSEISGDPEQLRKVLTNVLDNAIKFTVQGGIRVRVSVPEKGMLCIEVADTGPGIPPEQLPDIFETFRRASDYAQREHQGAGLGLSIAKQLVKSMGGQISVASTLGVGTTFTICLPIQK